MSVVVAVLVALAVLLPPPRGGRGLLGTGRRERRRGHSAKGDAGAVAPLRREARAGDGAEVSEALLCDAAAALLESGASLSSVLEHLSVGQGGHPDLHLVAKRLRWGAAPAAAWSGVGDRPTLRGLCSALELAAVSGAPASPLLREHAAARRRAAATDAEEAAAVLGVRLVVPLGACALPAFLCLGVVPIALSLLPWR